jgi:hypothetical protein
MTKKYLLGLSPSLLVAVAIIASTFIAVRAAGSGWMIMAAPLLLALTFVGADALSSRLREQGDGPSSAGLILGATFLVAGVVLTLRDPNLIKAFIPAVGAASWITLLMSRAGQRKPRPGI